MKIYGNDLGLDIGLYNLKNVNRNLSVSELVDDIVNNNEGLIGLRAAIVVTGIYTGRSPQDKYIVDEPSSNEKLWWGPVNKKISEDIFDMLWKITDYYNSTDHTKTYVFDGFAGADPNYSLNVKLCEKRQAHFVNNMFIRPKNGELDEFKPGFTIINASDVSNERFEEFGMNSETFIIFHMEKRIAIIGGTEYGGEMKRYLFCPTYFSHKKVYCQCIARPMCKKIRKILLSSSAYLAQVNHISTIRPLIVMMNMVGLMMVFSILVVVMPK